MGRQQSNNILAVLSVWLFLLAAGIILGLLSFINHIMLSL